MQLAFPARKTATPVKALLRAQIALKGFTQVMEPVCLAHYTVSSATTMEFARIARKVTNAMSAPQANTRPQTVHAYHAPETARTVLVKTNAQAVKMDLTSATVSAHLVL